MVMHGKVSLLFFWGSVLFILCMAGCDLFQFGLGEPVDLTPPEITVDLEANAFIKGNTTISGTITDDKGVAQMVLIYPGADGNSKNLEASIVDTNWSVEIPSGNGDSLAIMEGAQTISFKATDLSGKTSLVSRPYRVDNNAPTVVVTSPLSYVLPGDSSGLQMSKYIDLKGEVYDEFGISQVLVQLLNPAGTVIAEKTADGTGSWFARFLLKSSTDASFRAQLADNQVYTYRVIVTDDGGNSNTGYLHRSDFYAMIPGLSLFPSINEIGLADRNTPQPGSLVSSHEQLEAYRHYSEAEGTQLQGAGFIYSANDMPQVNYQNLDSGATLAGDNEVFREASILGYADPAANGPSLDETTIKAYFYKGAAVTPFLTLENTSDDDSDGIVTSLKGNSLNFELTLLDGDGNLFDVGDYRLVVTLEDSEGTLSPANDEVVFAIKSGEYPNLEVTSPGEGLAYTSASGTVFTLAGEVSYYAAELLAIELNGISYGPDDSELSFPSAGKFEFAVSQAMFDALPEGMQSITLTANAASLIWRFRKDTAAPTINVISPALESAHNGSVVFKGTASDTVSLSKMEIDLGGTGTWVELPGLYSWSYTISSVNDYTYDSYASQVEPDDYSPSTTSNFWLLPVHFRATDSAGNTFTRSDFKIFLDPSGDTPVLTILNPSDGEVTGGQIRVYGSASDDDSIFEVQCQLDTDNDNIFETPMTVTGTSSWFVILNKDGILESTTAGTQVTIKYQIRVIDSKDSGDSGDVVGPWQIRRLVIDNTIPSIEDIYIDYDSVFDDDYEDGLAEPYSSGMVVRGSFYLDFMAKDDTEITKVERISSTELNELAEVGSGTATEKQKHYRLAIDSNNLFPHSSGSLSLSIKVTDGADNPYVKYENITLLVDNCFPAGSYTSGTDVTGDFNVQGTASDMGAVQGVEKVLVFLKKEGSFYHPLTGASTTSVSDTLSDLWNGSSFINVDVPAAGTLVTLDDKPNFIRNSDGLGAYTWFTQLNSVNLPDGPMELHYMVVDIAGNTTYSVENLYIMNNPPQIESIELGTDLDFNDVIDADEYTSFNSHYDATDFTVRNSLLKVKINRVPGKGNGDLHYSMVDGLGTVYSGTMVSDSATISISSFEGDISGNGAHFDLLLFDSTLSNDSDSLNELNQSGTFDNTSLLTLAMNLKNTDNIAPFIEVAEMGDYFIDHEDYTQKTAVTVSSYHDNIGTDGGHVVYKGHSIHDGDDPDLSGQVIFYGKVQDNQIVDSIFVTIPGYNSDSAFAVYSGGSIVSGPGTGPDWTFAISDEYQTQTYGHVFNWTFTFDTEKISGSAQNNRTFSFSAQDSSANTDADNASIVADIVPYITGITRSNGNMHRSKYGKYPVQVGETLSFSGYNLTGATFTYPTGSSALTLSVNGIEALNNNNKNDSCWTNGSDEYYYNRMDNDLCSSDLSDSDWSDDVYFMVWQTGGNFTTSNGYYPSLTLGANGKLYGAWQDGLSKTYWDSLETDGTGDGEAIRAIFDTYDPADYTDISIDTASDASPAVVLLGNHVGINPTYGVGPYDLNNSGGIVVYGESAKKIYEQDSGACSVYGIEGAGADHETWQFLRPRVVTAEDRIHVAYFDNKTKAVKYSHVLDYGNNMGTITGYWDGSNVQGGWVVLDGGEDAQDSSGQVDINLQGTVTGTVNDANDSNSGTGSITQDSFSGLTAADFGLADLGDFNTDIRYIHFYDTRQTWITRMISGYSDNGTTGTISWDCSTLENPGNDFKADYGDLGDTPVSYRITASDGTNGRGVVSSGEARSSAAGEYVAIDLTPDKKPVVMYYDMDNSTLRLAYAATVAPETPGQWVRQNVLDVNSYSGGHIAMKIDSAGYIHAVFRQNDSGELLYIKSTNNSVNSVNSETYTFGAVEIIDDSGSVGKLADISLSSTNNPYVSYLGISVGTRDGLKYAYKDGSNWEYMVVPASASVATGDKQRTNIEYNALGNASWGTAVIGYLSNRFELIYLKGE